jgi:hypothetical protein
MTLTVRRTAAGHTRATATAVDAPRARAPRRDRRR